MLTRNLFLSCVAGLSLIFPGQFLAGAEHPFGVALDRRMPALLEQYQVPGAVVAYIQNGEVAWTQAYGLADVATGTPMRPDMVFNHGSDGKVLTAWGVMRLVEQGQVDLDAPINRYLKRWHLQSAEFNPDEVTPRRLLSHTAGLSAHGFNDYGPRRTLPNLIDVLEGRNQLDGAVMISWQPGTRFQYSGGGFVILQMMIEDITGEPFTTFMEREITGPLGLTSLEWAWTPELQAQAPTPYGLQQEPLAYRQLASQAIGSEISTVADFARFVAASVEGSNGEPIGRGVLQPETVRQMFDVQPNTNGTAGLAYGIGSGGGSKLLMHFGSNPGWNAHFVISVDRREGFVIANNSMLGDPLNLAVHFLWLETVLGSSAGSDPPPASNDYGAAAVLVQGVAALLVVSLLITAAWFAYELRSGRRYWSTARSHWSLPGTTRRIVTAIAWSTLALGWWYWFYTPWPLPLPTVVPDLWRLPPIDYVMGALVAWSLYALTMLFFPRRTAHSAAGVGKETVDRRQIWTRGNSVKIGAK